MDDPSCPDCRGRARAVNSHYLVLVEKGNMEHSDMLNQVARSAPVWTNLQARLC